MPYKSFFFIILKNNKFLTWFEFTFKSYVIYTTLMFVETGKYDVYLCSATEFWGIMEHQMQTKENVKYLFK